MWPLEITGIRVFSKYLVSIGLTLESSLSITQARRCYLDGSFKEVTALETELDTCSRLIKDCMSWTEMELHGVTCPQDVASVYVCLLIAVEWLLQTRIDLWEVCINNSKTIKPLTETHKIICGYR